ncbi:MAG: cytochrome c3 family protein [Gammaproteobacteria bacterium]
MRVLIRFLRRGPAGAVEQKDKLHDGEAVTLGRATDQVVQLKDRRVALAHARMVLRNGQPVLISQVPGGVLVNGTLQREARLNPGDTVSLGANLLRILEPVAGCDLAFSFELDAAARADELPVDLPRLRLADLGLAKRRWAWALFLGVLLLALLIPTTGLRSPALQDTLRGGLLPDDGFWSPGPVSRVHETVGARCEACHEKPFQRVRNEACLTCHAGGLHGHVGGGAAKDGVVLAEVQSVAALDEVRCASCHGEHHEPATLVRNDPAVCVTCHQDLRSTADWSQVTPQVTDFAADHPAFGVPERDESGLRFSHKAHLDAGGVRSPVGDTVLGCGDCHALEPGGARFRPLRMERDCGDCHLLDFDPAFPGRAVPHGDADRVAEFLVDYYSRRFLEGFADPLAAPAGVRRPAPQPTAAERERLLRDARAKAGLVLRDLFERRSCSQCHEVEATAGDPARWTVEPVAIRTAWLPGSRFSHDAHSTALTPCATCHEAVESAAATDVLLPGIDTCRDCHAGGDARATPANQVTSTCVLCHGFHQPQNPLWRVTAESS